MGVQAWSQLKNEEGGGVREVPGQRYSRTGGAL